METFQERMLSLCEEVHEWLLWGGAAGVRKDVW